MDSGTVTLRPFRVSDVDDFILWAGDDQVTRNIRWKTITSKEEALTFIKEVCIPHPWRRSICIDDRSIGFVSVYRWSGNEICKADIAYGIAAKYWGQGITTKAVKMAVLEVFKDFPDLVRLQAFAAVENKASQRVLEKAGFTKEDYISKWAEVVPLKEMDSGRVTLRPFRVSDVDDFILWAGDDQVTRNIRWKTVTSKEEALTFIKDVCIPHPWRRSICIDDRSIGFVSVYRWSGNDICKADIAYAIAAKYWGQGITTKAVKMAVSEVFKDFPDLVRLQAFAAVENKASQRVLEKAGFTKEGLLRKYTYLKGQLKDLVIYSFLSTDISVAVDDELL
uniref:N-acetyltransferase domain-containing protein n=2 Tax=Vitis vinifera TaxID=29760 RepID=F6HTV8_VITVI